MSWCTAFALALLGYVPSPNTTVTVARSQIVHYSARTQADVRACAARFHIRWKIDESK